MGDSISEKYEIFYYISSQADYNPAKTIYVCAPEKDAASYESAKRFAESSGWISIAERDGAVLVLPVARSGWKKEPVTLFAELFYETKGRFKSQNGRSLWGRDGYLWCWETLVYIVGYGDGAAFAGNAVVASPGLFTAAALVNGVPCDYSAGESGSGHYMVKSPGEGYKLRNMDIPSCLWLLLNEDTPLEEAREYFSRANGADETPILATLGGIPTQIYSSNEEPVRQLRISRGSFGAEPGLSQVIFEKLFQKVIRWKCGPDGRLTPFMSKEDFYSSPRFERDLVEVGGNKYEYFLHIPSGMTNTEAEGLPLVFSVHGRGEPAWMFAEKNGWDVLADETEEFILCVPDSPENAWFLERDGRAFGVIIEKISEKYGIDRTRVYLTGFSNGGAITREVGMSYPSYFAGLSPWNAPYFISESLAGWGNITERIKNEGWEMPYFMFCGDSDPAAEPGSDKLLPTMVQINHCVGEPKDGYSETFFTRSNGYEEGERFSTSVYFDSDGIPRVSDTVMKDMPHGAIHDESRAAWSFLKRFRRPLGSKSVEKVE